MSRRFLFQKFSVLSGSMPNRPTSAQGGDVSAIHDALRRFSTVLPNYHGLPVSGSKFGAGVVEVGKGSSTLPMCIVEQIHHSSVWFGSSSAEQGSAKHAQTSRKMLSEEA
uniref:Uncharacterized protein n=1 Tax=Oryza nivara TaxID=4536 RepID=A0A0E0JB02_ORYNI